MNLIGILLVGIFFILIFLVFFRTIRRAGGLDERLVTYAALPELERRGGSRRRAWLVRLRFWLNRTLSFLSSDEMVVQLQSANWPITVTEYLLVRIGGTILSFSLVILLFRNIFIAIGVAVILYIAPGIWLRFSINQRRRKFEKQLVDILVLITGAVKAGFSLLQGFEVVMHEITPPGSEELKRVLQEVSLGRPLSAALANMAQRMDNKDLNLLITAINIQYQVGGNLTTMLSAVTETIRERIRLYSELRALTSQQRLSSYILSLLPVIVLAVLFIINPEYMRGLFNREYWFIPAIGLFGIVTGALIIQRLVKMDF